MSSLSDSELLLSKFLSFVRVVWFFCLSDLSILTCSQRGDTIFSFSIILVLCRSQCLIIVSLAECESPLNRALSVPMHNITLSAPLICTTTLCLFDVLRCTFEGEKKAASFSLRMCACDFIIEMESNLFGIAADLLNTLPEMCLAGPRP